MLNHSLLAPTRRITLDFERLVISFYLKGLVRVAHAVISEILTGRFSRQLLVAATAKRSASSPHKAWTDPGRKLNRPSRRAGTPEKDLAMPRARSSKPLDASAGVPVFASWGEYIIKYHYRAC